MSWTGKQDEATESWLAPISPKRRHFPRDLISISCIPVSPAHHPLQCSLPNEDLPKYLKIFFHLQGHVSNKLRMRTDIPLQLPQCSILPHCSYHRYVTTKV